jgi:hypothetical protein
LQQVSSPPPAHSPQSCLTLPNPTQPNPTPTARADEGPAEALGD